MNRAQKSKSAEFISTLKKHILKNFKTNLCQYAMVLVLNLILFSCIEILPVYYVKLYVIQERMTVLMVSIMVVIFSAYFQAKVLAYLKNKKKHTIKRLIRNLLWIMIILLIILFLSAIISTVVTSLQSASFIRATIFAELLPQIVNFVIFPIYSTSILTVVLAPELNINAYYSKWIERVKATYFLLLIGSFLFGTLQMICQLFLEKPVPQIVSVISTALLWSTAALYENKHKRGKEKNEE